MFDTSKIKWSAVAALIAVAAQGKGSPLKRRAASLVITVSERENPLQYRARKQAADGETAA